MDQQTGPYALITVVVVILIFIVWWYVSAARKDQKAIAQRKQAYDRAVQDGNKRLALQTGREYYTALRGGKLTMFDELAIANDLSTIDSTEATSHSQ